jgi:hypothetical protein
VGLVVDLLVMRMMEVLLSSEVVVDLHLHLQAPEDSWCSGLDGHFHCHRQDRPVEEDLSPLYSHHDSHHYHHFHAEADVHADPHDRDSNVDREDAS